MKIKSCCQDALLQSGMKEPKLNMEIPLSDYDKNGQQEKNFTLSGWFIPIQAREWALFPKRIAKMQAIQWQRTAFFLCR